MSGVLGSRGSLARGQGARWEGGARIATRPALGVGGEGGQRGERVGGRQAPRGVGGGEEVGVAAALPVAVGGVGEGEAGAPLSAL